MIVPDSIEEKIKQLTRNVMAKQRQLAAFASKTLQSSGLSPSIADIEDVLSDAYLTAATRLRIEEYLSIEHYYAWYRRFLYFACLKFAEKKGRLPTVQLTNLEEEVQLLEIVDAHRRGINPDASLLVQELLKNLDETDQDILISRAAGYEYKEIAKKLNMSEESVRKRKSRASKALKELMK